MTIDAISYRQLLNIISENINDWYLIIKLILLNNTIIEYDNTRYVDKFLSHIHEFNMNIKLENDYLIYCNPIHVCALLAFETHETCANILKWLLGIYNIVPINFKVQFQSKKDLLFYARIFGANDKDLMLLYSIVNMKLDNVKSHRSKLVNEFDIESSFIYDGIFSDYISIIHGDRDNLDRNRIHFNPYMFNFIKFKLPTNIEGRYPDKNILYMSMHKTICTLTELDEDELYETRDDTFNNQNFNTALYMLYTEKINLKFINNIGSISEFTEKMTDPRTCYEKIVNNLYKKTSNSQSLELEIVLQFINSNGPFDLARKYTDLKRRYYA